MNAAPLLALALAATARAWQLYDAAGKPAGPPGRDDGVPVNGNAAAFTNRDGNFTVLY